MARIQNLFGVLCTHHFVRETENTYCVVNFCIYTIISGKQNACIRQKKSSWLAFKGSSTDSEINSTNLRNAPTFLASVIHCPRITRSNIPQNCIQHIILERNNLSLSTHKFYRPTVYRLNCLTAFTLFQSAKLIALRDSWIRIFTH
jgi:hypothetical protein